MNTDQGSQFTSFAWTNRLRRAGTRISMDGKGRCIDNVFIERLWRSLKSKCVLGKPDRRPKPPSVAGSYSAITRGHTLSRAGSRRCRKELNAVAPALNT
ncbi:MAG TPA: hypothetical protein DEB47_09505 [Citreicella sp.]|nr:hypothetical protein [Citreicella sp.]